MTTMFTPTTFDKAFVRAVEYLLKSGRVATQKEIADQIGITPQALHKILKSLRGVPREKNSLATFYLTNTCGVSKEFLKTNRGAIMLDPDQPDTSEFPQYSIINVKLKDCEKELQFLRNKIKDQEQVINVQKDLIESLKKSTN